MTDRGPPGWSSSISRARVAEIIVTVEDGQRRGSGYRVTTDAVLTAAHVIDGATSVTVRFEPDLPDEWSTDAETWWADAGSDLGVVSIRPRSRNEVRSDELRSGDDVGSGELRSGDDVRSASSAHVDESLAPVRFGRIGDRAAVLAVQAVGFPRWKMRNYDGTTPTAGDDQPRYRDAHHAVGSVAVLSNWREGTLEVVVPPAPAIDQLTAGSPWQGMSGAALWAGEHIIGVIAEHHPADGPARLAAVRLDLALDRLDPARIETLRAVLPERPEHLPDVLPPPPGELITTAYQAQLVDIAPDELYERESEVAELVRFSAGEDPYWWWQAGPWAGKSAMLSWFALHPPAGVDVVSFFITSRFAGQSDSDAFADAMIEQLAALCGEPAQAVLEARARRGHMLRLLRDAARRGAVRGRRLLVVVDGLDEDGVAGAGAAVADRPSVASLLPRRLPPEVRVLVSSRPHPGLPDDVPGDHPLRTVAPRTLSGSAFARDQELAAKFELSRLLGGSSFQRDVLGLITASGGGLSRVDLEQLTGRPPYDVDRLLAGHFGRSVNARLSPTPGPGRPTETVYVLAHETLRAIAEQQFGSSLAGYRDRIHSWAEDYRVRGWPPDTPSYLLRAYTRLLADIGDLARSIVFATDRARHDRMLDTTGGDARALAEVATTTALLVREDSPDLGALLLLGAVRDDLAERNARLPPELPAIWMTVGYPDRAMALANGIADVRTRTRAVIVMIEAAARAGEIDRVPRLVAAAEQLVREIPASGWRAVELAQLVRAIAKVGDHDRALALLWSIPDPSSLAGALASLIASIAATGQRARAIELAITAERLAVQIDDPAARVAAMADLAGALAGAGYAARSLRLAGAATQLAREIPLGSGRAQALCRLVGAVAVASDVKRAERLAREIDDAGWRAQAVAGLIGLIAARGDHDHARALANEIADDNWREEAKAGLVGIVGATGDHARAERMALEIDDPGWRAQALAELVGVVAATGDRSAASRIAASAEQVARVVPQARSRAEALAALAVAVGATGRPADVDRAHRLAQEIPNPASRLQALTRLAGQYAESGDRDRAVLHAAGAEQLAREVPDTWWRVPAMIHLVAAIAGAGESQRALELAVSAERLAPCRPRPGMAGEGADRAGVGGRRGR